MQLTPYRNKILAAEFAALVVLIGSMVAFSQFTQDGQPPQPALWLIPIIASLVVISGFCANLYIRWVENPDTKHAKPVQKLFVYLLIATLYLFWFFAVTQAWLSHQAIQAAG